jgi:antitoxin VapB
MGALVTTKLFRSNRSQAVRLPKEVAFPDHVKEVRILKEGNTRVIVPADSVWDDFFDSEPYPDFPDRDQPPMQERDWS